MTDFRSAVVFGKYWPLHVGHLELISAASARADQVTVVVDDGEEDVPTAVRMGWIAEVFPSANVVTAPDLCGHDTIHCTPECSERYAAWLTEHQGNFDAVFSGDTYGGLLAGCLEATWVNHDRSISGAAGRVLRADIPGNWHLLSAPARAWYCKRVVILGAESTGTTTLAADLAEHLGTVWVPEYGRQFTEEHGLDHDWQSQDFEEIAHRQTVDEDVMARRSGPVLICDTDILATAVWHERYLDSSSQAVEALANTRRPDVYVLTSDDIPFVQDGLRDGEHLRVQMTERFRQVLACTGIPWLEVRGGRNHRVTEIKEALRGLLGIKWMAQSKKQTALMKHSAGLVEEGKD